MNARDHFEMAERLLASCQLDAGDDRNAPTYPAEEDGVNSIGNALAAAQVHATLALAASQGAHLRLPGEPVVEAGSAPPAVD